MIRFVLLQALERNDKEIMDKEMADLQNDLDDDFVKLDSDEIPDDSSRRSKQ